MLKYRDKRVLGLDAKMQSNFASCLTITVNWFHTSLICILEVMFGLLHAEELIICDHCQLNNCHP